MSARYHNLISFACALTLSCGLGLFFTSQTYDAANAGGLVLGPFFAAFFLAVFMLPFLGQVSLLCAGGAWLGLSLATLPMVARAPISITQWTLCCLLLLAWGIALVGMTRLLGRLLGAYIASGAAILLSLMWLTWPVWMSPHLNGVASGPLVERLVIAHPLFAANGVLSPEQTWAASHMAYKMTILGQDISYGLPTSVLPTLAWHGFIGFTMLAISVVRKVRPSAKPTFGVSHADSPIDS